MKIKKGSINYYLLLTLEKAAEGLVILGSFSYASQRRALLGIPDPPDRLALVQAIRRLRKKGIIEQEISDDGKIIIKLTSLGKDFLGKDEEWDGKYRIVIWDIPEKKRRIRNLFRRRLKDWGFKGWQKSVWISKRNVTGKLRKLISDLEMQGMVAIIESDDPSLSFIKVNDRSAY